MFPGSLFGALSLNDFQNSDPPLRRCNRPGKRGGAGIRSRELGGVDPVNLDHIASERAFASSGIVTILPITVGHCQQDRPPPVLTAEFGQQKTLARAVRTHPSASWPA
jgi:hypothetical protein